jgi:hypothetical protein
MQVVGVDDGGDGFVHECMSEWGKDEKKIISPHLYFHVP